MHQRRLAHLQQRPVQLTADARHAADALRTGAPQQVHQHRLRLIVQVVGQCDAVCAAAQPRLAQKAVARLTGGGLQALSGLPGDAGNVRMALDQLDAEPVAQLPAQRHVRIRIRAANAVVEVRGSQPERIFLAGLRQQAGQRHGIRAARECDEQVLAAHIVKANLRKLNTRHGTLLQYIFLL